MDKSSTRYDFFLLVVSVLLLALIGALFLSATAYGWWQSLGDPVWTYGPDYGQFVEFMNGLLLPLLIMLIVMLGLCLPKRLWTKLPLIVANILFLIIAAVASFLFGVNEGLRVFIIICLVFQGAVVCLTFFAGGRLRFELEGFYARIGSSLLHFAFVILSADFIIWPNSDLHLPLFWLATTLLILGSAMSFYGRPLAAALKYLRSMVRSSGP